MKLVTTQDSKGRVYVLECEYDKGQIARKIGFTWWTIIENKWATRSEIVASRAVQWADQEAYNALQPILSGQRENAEASMATRGGSGETIMLPHGLRLLPFQEASVSYMIKILK